MHTNPFFWLETTTGQLILQKKGKEINVSPRKLPNFLRLREHQHDLSWLDSLRQASQDLKMTKHFIRDLQITKLHFD